jgi:hypothetical protein
MKKLALICSLTLLITTSAQAFVPPLLPYDLFPTLSAAGVEEAAALAIMTSRQSALIAAVPEITAAAATGGVAVATSRLSPWTALSVTAASVVGFFIWYDYYNKRNYAVQLDKTIAVTHPDGYALKDGKWQPLATVPATGGTQLPAGVAPITYPTLYVNSRESIGYHGCSAYGDPNCGSLLSFKRVLAPILNVQPSDITFGQMYLAEDKTWPVLVKNVATDIHVTAYDYYQPPKCPPSMGAFNYRNGVCYPTGTVIPESESAGDTCTAGYTPDGAGSCVLTDASGMLNEYNSRVDNRCTFFKNTVDGTFYTLDNDPACAKTPGITKTANTIVDSANGGSIGIRTNSDGSTDLFKSTPHPDTGTSEVTTAHAVPESPNGGKPTVNSVDTKYYPGTGTAADPVPQLATPATGSGGQTGGPTPVQPVQVVNPQVNVNFPSKMDVSGSSIKVDAEGKSSTDVPDADGKAGEYEDPKNLFSPISDKFKSVTDIQFQSHTSQCMTFSFNFNYTLIKSVPMTNFRYSSTDMCDMLEKNKALAQGIVSFSYILIAILIFLGA